MIDIVKILILPVGTLVAGSVIGAIVGMLNWYHPGKRYLKTIGYAVYVSLITFTAAPEYLDPVVALAIGFVSIVGVGEVVEWYADKLLPIDADIGMP